MYMALKRVKAVLEYDGTGYCGFQRQASGVPTIQSEVELALYKLTSCNIQIFASGRTDTGVHAIGQVIHFDIESKFSTDEIIGALNHFLQNKFISVLKLSEVSNNFNARFDALERTYIYKIICRNAPLVLEVNRAWHIKYTLDIEKMREASFVFLGRHNFNSFRSSECQSSSPIRTINNIEIIQENNVISIIISAKSFLHNQVRIMVGALKEIGGGKWMKQDILNALAAEDRKEGPVTAPPCGLYFWKVRYGEEYG